MHSLPLLFIAIIATALVEYVDDVVVVDDDIYEGDIDHQASLTKPLLGLQYIPHAPFLNPKSPSPTDLSQKLLCTTPN